MPRTARKKSPECIYHIMCRSLSEIQLFKVDEDKNRYLKILKKYIDRNKCSIYAYCMMDNHLHIHFDPRGFDVSKFMHSVNTAYVRYYNNKYDRHGHLFQGRFTSRIITSNEYNMKVSAYIHNNPKDIEGYNGREETYPFSSYGIYLGIKKDIHGLIDIDFMLSLFNAVNKDAAKMRYAEFVKQKRDIGFTNTEEKEFIPENSNEYCSGRKIILREQTPEKLLSLIAKKLNVPVKTGRILKSKMNVMEFRSFCVYALRTLCDLSYREICNNMYNLTVSGCSNLCGRGYLLTQHNNEYEKLFNELSDLAPVC